MILPVRTVIIVLMFNLHARTQALSIYATIGATRTYMYVRMHMNIITSYYHFIGP